MKLVVGLGNPGPEYEVTRHNVGFLAVDRLIDRWNAKGPSKESRSETFKADFRGEKVLLVKPLTFMNRSGEAVQQLSSFYKVPADGIVVIHDDLDLPPLSLRIKTGGGDGGHNGLKSIDQQLGALGRGYHRVRIGIGKPPASQPGRDTADWVLSAFPQAELDLLDKLLDDAATAVELCLEDNAKEAMSRFNRKATPSEDPS